MNAPEPQATPAGTTPAGDTLHARRDALMRELAATPWRYDFFHALRLIDALNPDRPRLGQARRPVDEPVRLGQAADLSFAPSTISRAVPMDRSGRPRIEVRFFGLFGPNGPLPLHLTSYARERSLHRGDDTFARFADWFHHRLLLLFYRAWAQAQPTVSLDRPGDDRYADYVGSLFGNGGAEWRGRDAAPDHARLAFAGLLSRQARNADGLANLLSGFLGMAVRVEQFVGRWMPLPEAERSRIGGIGAFRRAAGAQLGMSTVLGRAVFDRQHHLRIHIGPLSLAAFESLLPSGRALPPLVVLVRQYLGLEFGWDLHLLLAPGDVPSARLGRQGRLGWTSWMRTPVRTEVAALNIEPDPASA